MNEISRQITLEVLTSIDSIISIREQWQELDAALHGNYFQSFGYYQGSVECLTGPESKPHVLLFKKANQVVGLFPWVERKVKHRGIPFSVIGPIRHDHTYLNDVLCATDYQDEVIQLFKKYLNNLRFNQYILVAGVKSSGSFINLAKNNIYGQILQISMGYSSEIVSPFFGDELNVRTKTLKNVKRLLRKAEREGVPRFEFVRGPHITPGHYQAFLDVEASGWKGQSGTGTAIALDPVLNKYYWRLIELSGDRIQLGLYYFNDIPIAANFAYIDGNRTSLIKVGYNEEYGKLSPSHTLIYQTLLYCRQSFNVQLLSFVTSRQWQEIWANNKEELSMLIIHRSKLLFRVIRIFRKLKFDYRKN